jgi:hypothetical protein
LGAGLVVCVLVGGGFVVGDVGVLGDAEAVGVLVGVAAGGVWAASGRAGAEVQAAAAASDVSASAVMTVSRRNERVRMADLLRSFDLSLC